jgi:hypothetical protein
MEAERDVRSIRVWAGLLGLQGTVVEDVAVSNEGGVVVAVRPGWRQRDRCGLCRRRSGRYDAGGGRRRWRALDVGTAFCWLEADAPRVSCRRHGVVVAAVPWARHDSRFTRAFEDQVVRHEALLDRVGCKNSLPGCRSSSVKQGAAWTVEMHGLGGSSPVKAGTGQHHQMAGVRRARQRDVTQVNQWLNPRNPRTGSKSDGSGPGRSARPPRTMRWSSPKAAQSGCLGGREEGLRRTHGDAVGAQLDVDPVKRSTVNMGTAAMLPRPGQVVWSRGRSSSADGVVAGRSLRSSPGTGKPSTWRREAASSQQAMGMAGGHR